MGNICIISHPIGHRITTFDPERYYVRERLESLIFRQKKLSYINVSAEAGYGKSSFIYSYISRIRVPAVWIDAGEPFSDMSVFLRNLAEGISMLLYGNDTVPDTNVQEYIIRTLFSLETPFYLVIDHFQFIQQDEEIRDFLNKILTTSFPHFTLVTLSTVQPCLSVTRLKAAGNYLELTTEDLSFTYEEISGFFTQYHDIPLEKYEIDIIYKETEGWIAGCQLILLYLEQTVDGDTTRPWLNNFQALPDIYDYMNHEIFEKVPEDLQDFTIKTSLLTELDPDIINPYLDIRNAEENILYLQKHNLGLTKTKFGTFQYQHLFRLFLYEQYNRKAPDSIQDGHLRLSYIFEERHQFLDAFVHAAASLNYLRASEVMYSISFRYNPLQILHIIDGKLDEISPLLVLPDTTLFLSRCIPEEILHEFPEPLETELQAALRNKEYLNAALLQHRLSSIYYHLGDMRKTTDMLNRTLKSAQLLKDYALSAFSLQLLADCCFEMGDYKTSMIYARQALFLTEQYQIRPLQIHCLEVLSRLQTDPEQAESCINQALDLAAPGSYAVFWLYAAKSHILRASNPEEAVTWAKRSVSALSPYCCGHDRSYTNRILGEALLSCGEYESAASALETAYRSSSLCALERLHTLESQIRLAEASGQTALAQQKQSELTDHCIRNVYTWMLSEPVPKKTSDPGDFPVLTVQTFGKFSVMQNGHPISFKRASSLRIFQFLITNRNAEKNRDVIAEEIFPVTKTDHRNHFHVALSALRKDLNPPDAPKGTSPYIVRNRDNYWLNMKYIRLDVDEFLDISTAQYRTQEERIAKLLQADDLYKGDYFEEYPYEYYLETEREHLRKIQVKNLYEIAEYYCRNREFAQAVNYYEKIIRTDPYEESAYLQCCTVMLQAHAVQKARKTAQKMIQVIEGELKVPCRERLDELFRNQNQDKF